MITRLMYLLLTSSLLLSASAKEAISLKFCEDPWPPYTYGEIGEQPSGGYAVEFLKEISQRININIEMLLLPWKRCLSMAEKGGVDGVMLLTGSEERSVYLEFTTPLMSDNNLTWYKKSGPLKGGWADFSDLAEFRIGVAAGFNYGDKYNAAKEKYQFKTDVAKDVKTNFEKLIRGRTDVYFVNLTAANYALKGYPDLRSKVTYEDQLFEKVPFYIGFSRKSKNRKYINDFNSAIDAMLKEGVIKNILEH